MKFTLSWLKEHLDTDGVAATRSRDALTDARPRGRGHRRPRPRRSSASSSATSSRRCQHPNADRLRVCRVDTGQGVVQVVCGAPNARTGMKGVFAPAGSYIPGTGLRSQGGRDPRRGVQRHARAPSASWSSARTIAASSSCRPRRAIGAPAAEALGLDDPVIEIKAHAQPRRLPGRARHRARPRRGRARHAEAGRTADTIAGTLRQPDQVDARLRAAARQPLPDRRRPLFPRREERPVARLAAGPAEGDRPAADLGPGRHHQLRDLRPRPAAARLRRRQARRRPRHAPGARRRDRSWRSTARPTRSTRQ